MLRSAAVLFLVFINNLDVKAKFLTIETRITCNLCRTIWTSFQNGLECGVWHSMSMKMHGDALRLR
jgi:hypothetical protein